MLHWQHLVALAGNTNSLKTTFLIQISPVSGGNVSVYSFHSASTSSLQQSNTILAMFVNILADIRSRNSWVFMIRDDMFFMSIHFWLKLLGNLQDGTANFKILGVKFACGKFAHASEVCALHFVKLDSTWTTLYKNDP